MDTPRIKCPKCRGSLNAAPLLYALARWCPGCRLLYVRPQDDAQVREEVHALGGLAPFVPARAHERLGLKRAA